MAGGLEVDPANAEGEVGLEAVHRRLEVADYRVVAGDRIVAVAAGVADTLVEHNLDDSSVPIEELEQALAGVVSELVDLVEDVVLAGSMMEGGSFPKFGQVKGLAALYKAVRIVDHSLLLLEEDHNVVREVLSESHLYLLRCNRRVLWKEARFAVVAVHKVEVDSLDIHLEDLSVEMEEVEEVDSCTGQTP